MKKLFYLVALVAAVSFTACGNKGENKEAEGEKHECCQGKHEGCKGECKHQVSQDVLDLAARMEKEMKEEDQSDLLFKGIEVKCHNMIVNAEFDESQLPEEMTVKQAFEKNGVTPEIMQAQLLRGMEADEERAEDIAILRENHINLVYRIVGSRSGEEFVCTIPSEMMPE